MKKAKLMLSAIAVVGLVSGALAFQAKFGQLVVYTTSAGSICDQTLTIQPAVLSNNPSDPTVFATLEQGENCTTITYTTQE